MKKKKFDFDEVKVGEYFMYYNVVYRKIDGLFGVSLIGKKCDSVFFSFGDKVIPVTVTIKVKEK